MGKLYYELDSIDIKTSDRDFSNTLGKYYQSQRKSKIYNDIMQYDIEKLSQGKKDIFILWAKKIFELVPEESKQNIDFLVKHYTEYYVMKDVNFGKFKDEDATI
jgi:hypothetical protein